MGDRYDVSIDGVIEKLHNELTWRGPGEARTRDIMLEREYAAFILEVFRDIKKDRPSKFSGLRES